MLLLYSFSFIFFCSPSCGGRCSVFFLPSFRPTSSNLVLHNSNIPSTWSQFSPERVMLSASSIVHGVSSSISLVMTTMIIINRSGLSADPWCKPILISISPVSPTVMLASVMLSSCMFFMISISPLGRSFFPGNTISHF